MSVKPIAARLADIVKALEHGPLTAEEIADRVAVRHDNVHVYIGKLHRDRAIVLTDKRVSVSGRLCLRVWGLPDRDPVYAPYQPRCVPRPDRVQRRKPKPAGGIKAGRCMSRSYSGW